ncbi:uncharacterized protein LOC143127827 [Alosa pseudoharengus]|uniref:uncharacterized protein LOC143127827 n=1 Tax=Alosa pseudoharengus TaxID=34774 RepID=UPI003F899E0F
MEGRYVSVFIPGEGKQLALAEVQVFGKPAENQALGKEATQSSDFLYYTYSYAKNAVDGSRANSDHSVCSGTNGQDYPWWKVDLLEDYNVTTVTITSRGDCCEHLLINAEIHISSSPEISTYSKDSLCVVMEDGIPRGATNTYVCPDMSGRYLAVLIRGLGGYVFLCEVEVTGVPAVIPTPTPAPTTPTIPPPSPPPPLTLLVSGRTVVLVREHLSWYDALLHCRSLYRDLASLRSPEEQLEVGEALLLRGAHTAHVWLGLRRRMLSSVWYWMNGEEMDHSSWEGGRPRYHEIPGTSACGAAANMVQFLWSDRHCKEQLNFLCYTDDDPDYSPVQFTITYART